MPFAFPFAGSSGFCTAASFAGRSELSHTSDEHVEAAEVVRAVDVYAAITRHYFAR